jgi:hypothetical protein
MVNVRERSQATREELAEYEDDGREPTATEPSFTVDVVSAVHIAVNATPTVGRPPIDALPAT